MKQQERSCAGESGCSKVFSLKRFSFIGLLTFTCSMTSFSHYSSFPCLFSPLSVKFTASKIHLFSPLLYVSFKVSKLDLNSFILCQQRIFSTGIVCFLFGLSPKDVLLCLSLSFPSFRLTSEWVIMQRSSPFEHSLRNTLGIIFLSDLKCLNYITGRHLVRQWCSTYIQMTRMTVLVNGAIYVSASWGAFSKGMHRKAVIGNSNMRPH